MTLRVFGLTGGLASGKSAVAKMFRDRKIPVIDADQLAREVVEKGSEGLAEVVKVFGDEVLLPDGSLDRAKVAERVFKDPQKRRALNAIVHPRIAALSAQRIAELSARGEPLACYEAALLVENGLADAFRPLVVVGAPESLQIARIVKRDGATEAEARARIASQKPLAEKIAVADVVIDNAGTLAELEAAADRALDEVTDRLGIPRFPPC